MADLEVTPTLLAALLLATVLLVKTVVDVCTAAELAVCVDVIGTTTLCVVVCDTICVVTRVTVAGGAADGALDVAHSAAMNTCVISSSSWEQFCWIQLRTSCWIFVFAQRHCLSVL